MTIPESPDEQSSVFCRSGFLVLVLSVGVGSLAVAGFLGPRWLGFTLLGVGCIMLAFLIRLLVCE
jgi:hypothetical protein